MAGREATLTIGVSEDAAWRLAVVPTFGFVPVRYFLRMSRRLDESLPVVSLPPGYLIRPVAGPDEFDAWVHLYNTAFADHWEHHEMATEERRREIGRASHRADFDLVAVAPDGAPAAFCWASIRDLDRVGVEAWINLVGTHPSHRRLGLARALLATGLATLRDHGMTEAKLSVDSESPTGATSLDKELGFTVAKMVTVFRRPVRG